jgi:hypothetical protein
MRTFAFVQAAQTLGGSAGRTYSLPNEAPAMVGCVHVVLVTTATAGSRTLVLRILDATGNVLFEGQQNGSVAASLTSRQNWGAGMVSGTSGIYILNGLPDMSVPPNAQINIFDSANGTGIDANDTIATTATLADPR